ncbi:hypothetical protein PIROE2DRAFT_17922, partial [Piromyces sp. E2]
MSCPGIFFLLLIFIINSSIESSINSNEKNNQNIKLNLIGYSLDSGSASFTYYVNSFNEYSKENNLNITLNFNLISNTNTTFSLDNLGNMIDDLLIKQTTKYDLFFYDNTLTSNYGPHLLNLNKWIPKEHIEMYNQQILSQIAYYGDNLVGI